MKEREGASVQTESSSMISTFPKASFIPVERLDIPKELFEESMQETSIDNPLNAPCPPIFQRGTSSIYVGKRILSMGDEHTANTTRVWLHRKIRATPTQGTVRLGFVLQKQHHSTTTACGNGACQWKVATAQDTVQMVDVRVEKKDTRVEEEFAALQWIVAQQQQDTDSLKGLHLPQIIMGAEGTEFLYCLQPHEPTCVSLAAYLGQHRNDGRGLAEPQAKSFFRQIVQGLESLERMGICHRNINLETIVVVRRDASKDHTNDNEEEYHCLLSELGTCQKITSNKAMHSAVHQTSQFVPPEVWNGNTVRSGLDLDLWAAGVVLSVLITGGLFAAPVLADPRYRAIAMEHQSCESCDGVVSLLRRMLSLDPQARLPLQKLWSHPWLQR